MAMAERHPSSTTTTTTNGREGKSAALALYRAMTSFASPFLHLYLCWRRARGLEHPVKWQERLGHASLPRPPGPLLWFHAVSVGETMAAIPVRVLPHAVLCQFVPIDTPYAVDNFLSYWRPEAGIFMESELWPNLLLASSRKGMTLALLNARMSIRSFERWMVHIAKPLAAEMLSRFSLIAPLSTKEAVHFQILGASPNVIHYAGNLKYALEAIDDVDAMITQLKTELSSHCVWIAASTHTGEEDVIASVHKDLRKSFPNVVTIISPRHPERGHQITSKLRQQGFVVAQRSCGDHVASGTDIYVLDSIGELRMLYHISPIAFVGGSLFSGLAGHNLAEAASAGCAVLTGPYIGHFSEMVLELQRLSPVSIQQVSGKDELLSVLQELFGDAERLKIRREAARWASGILANGVITRVWALLDLFVMRVAFGK